MPLRPCRACATQAGPGLLLHVTQAQLAILSPCDEDLMVACSAVAAPETLQDVLNV